jgi:hypothetical protein
MSSAQERERWQGQLPATLLQLTSNTRARVPGVCPSLLSAALPGKGLGGNAFDDS